MKPVIRCLSAALLLAAFFSCTHYDYREPPPCPPDGGVGVVGPEGTDRAHR